jgi:hypothetical protein
MAMASSLQRYGDGQQLAVLRRWPVAHCILWHCGDGQQRVVAHNVMTMARNALEK